MTKESFETKYDDIVLKPNQKNTCPLERTIMRLMKMRFTFNHTNTTAPAMTLFKMIDYVKNLSYHASRTVNHDSPLLAFWAVNHFYLSSKINYYIDNTADSAAVSYLEIVVPHIVPNSANPEDSLYSVENVAEPSVHLLCNDFTGVTDVTMDSVVLSRVADEYAFDASEYAERTAFLNKTLGWTPQYRLNTITQDFSVSSGSRTMKLDTDSRIKGYILIALDADGNPVDINDYVDDIQLLTKNGKKAKVSTDVTMLRGDNMRDYGLTYAQITGLVAKSCVKIELPRMGKLSQALNADSDKGGETTVKFVFGIKQSCTIMCVQEKI